MIYTQQATDPSLIVDIKRVRVISYVQQLNLVCVVEGNSLLFRRKSLSNACSETRRTERHLPTAAQGRLLVFMVMSWLVRPIDIKMWEG